MGVINRGALAIPPRDPMQRWLQSVDPATDAIDTDPSLYLVPVFETGQEAEQVLGNCYAQILELELESWMLDRSTWPKQRDLSTFLFWFEITRFELVEDLADEDLLDESVEQRHAIQEHSLRSDGFSRPLRIVKGVAP